MMCQIEKSCEYKNPKADPTDGPESFPHLPGEPACQHTIDLFPRRWHHHRSDEQRPADPGDGREDMKKHRENVKNLHQVLTHFSALVESGVADIWGNLI
jgi:hypothetical protein